MKVTRLEEAKVKPNKCEAYTSDVTFPAWDTDTTCGIQPSPLLFKRLPWQLVIITRVPTVRVKSTWNTAKKKTFSLQV